MPHYFATVYGAGLAGCAIANYLLNAGKSVLIVDPRVDLDGTPGPPAALVNPAMGRYAKLSWEAEACHAAIRERAYELMQFSGQTDLIAETGVMRPAINEDLAVNFKAAIDAHDWPEGWISWIDADETMQRVPALDQPQGALFLPHGFTVYVEKYQNAYRKLLSSKGATFTTEEFIRKELPNGQYELSSSSGEVHTSENIIVAAGSGSLDFPEFSEVPLHRVKGQIATFEADHDLDWEIAVSAMGYILRIGARGIVVGSTYEHNQNNLDLTEQAYQQILYKMFKIMPSLSGRIRKTGQQAGIRVTTPNKLPVIGRHPSHLGLSIYTALGSKGLLFSEFVGAILGDHLVNDAPISEDLDVKRYFVRDE